jgi:methylmalonyl-CoA mutase cobalamin-binding subunit
VVAAVSRHRPAPPPTGVGSIAVACLDGEWHGLPARLLAEVLARHGWAVHFLGASVPADQIAVHVHSAGPDVVAVSSSLPSRLPAARRMVEVCRATGTPVLAGGPAFGEDGRWARAVGADGWAPDARAAAELLNRDPSGRWFEAARAAEAVDDAVPTGDEPVAGEGVDAAHRASAGGADESAREEQAVVHARRGELVAAVAGRLRPDVAARGPVPALPEALADDLGHLVDFLAAAVFVDDATLLGEFVRWVGTVSIPQGLSRDEALAALEHLAVLLEDSPRAQGFLREAREGARPVVAGGPS